MGKVRLVALKQQPYAGFRKRLQIAAGRCRIAVRHPAPSDAVRFLLGECLAVGITPRIGLTDVRGKRAAKALRVGPRVTVDKVVGRRTIAPASSRLSTVRLSAPARSRSCSLNRRTLCSSLRNTSNCPSRPCPRPAKLRSEPGSVPMRGSSSVMSAACLPRRTPAG